MKNSFNISRYRKVVPGKKDTKGNNYNNTHVIIVIINKRNAKGFSTKRFKYSKHYDCKRYFTWKVERSNNQ